MNDKINTPESLLSRATAAQYLGISQRKLDQLRERGELKGHWVGGLWRIKPSEIETYLEANKVAA